MGGGRNPSAAGAAIRLLAHGLREGIGRSSTAGWDAWRAPLSPRRRVSVERAGIRADPARVAAYLRATGGDASAARAAPGAPLPPLYPAVWETALALELLMLGELPFPRGGLVHLGGETVQIRAAPIGEPIACRAELHEVEPASDGARITVQCRNWDEKGRLCSEDTVILLARTGSATGGGSGRGAAQEPQHEREWQLLASWPLAAGAGRRYARASGDYNPIHLWALTARPFGFRRAILQGFCTEAMVAHAIIQRRLAGRSAALRRIEISFRAPVWLPGNARLLIAPDGDCGRFRVICDGSTKPAAEGSWLGQG